MMIWSKKKRIYVGVDFLLAVILIVIDQFTKYLAVLQLKDKPAYPIIDGIFELRYLENRGAAFGMLQNQQTFFLIIGIVTLIAVAIIYARMPHTKRYLPLRVCLVSIVTGAIGNMIDRIRLDYVIDFLYFKLINFPIFNVADIFATCATIALILLLIVYYNDDDIDEVYNSLKFNKNK